MIFRDAGMFDSPGLVVNEREITIVGETARAISHVVKQLESSLRVPPPSFEDDGERKRHDVPLLQLVE